MRALPGQEIAGIRLSALKTFFRRHSESFSTPTFMVEMKITEPKASAALHALTKAGFVSFDQTDGFIDWWKVAGTGQRLMATKIRKPVSRSRADKAVTALIATARAINASDEYPTYVTRIVLFGSYVRGAAEVGDIDTACDFQNRLQDWAAQDALEKRIQKADLKSGFFRPHHPMDWYSYPSDKANRALRKADRLISLHEVDDLCDTCMEIYRFDPKSGLESLECSTYTAPPSDRFKGTISPAVSRACKDPVRAPAVIDPLPRLAEDHLVASPGKRGALWQRRYTTLLHRWTNGATFDELRTDNFVGWPDRHLANLLAHIAETAPDEPTTSNYRAHDELARAYPPPPVLIDALSVFRGPSIRSLKKDTLRNLLLGMMKALPEPTFLRVRVEQEPFGGPAQAEARLFRDNRVVPLLGGADERDHRFVDVATRLAIAWLDDIGLPKWMGIVAECACGWDDSISSRQAGRSAAATRLAAFVPLLEGNALVQSGEDLHRMRADGLAQMGHGPEMARLLKRMSLGQLRTESLEFEVGGTPVARAAYYRRDPGEDRRAAAEAAFSRWIKKCQGAFEGLRLNLYWYTDETERMRERAALMRTDANLSPGGSAPGSRWR